VSFVDKQHYYLPYANPMMSASRVSSNIDDDDDMTEMMTNDDVQLRE
jgi:hypothetical protein